MQAAGEDGHVTLTWQPVPGAGSYSVYRTDSTQHQALIGSTTSTTFIDVGGVDGGVYTYQLVADGTSATPIAPNAAATVTWIRATRAPSVLAFAPTESTVARTATPTSHPRSRDRT